MKNLSGDGAFFNKFKKNKLDGICILHVDDFLISGSKEFQKEVLQKLKGRFTFGKIEVESFKFTGLNIVQKEDGIYVDQNEYVQSINEIEVKRNVDKEAKLTPKEFKAFRGLTR